MTGLTGVLRRIILAASLATITTEHLLIVPPADVDYATRMVASLDKQSLVAVTEGCLPGPDWYLIDQAILNSEPIAPFGVPASSYFTIDSALGRLVDVPGGAPWH